MSLLAYSCERDTDLDLVPEEGMEVDVQFDMDLPADMRGQGVTRALSDTDEATVTTVDVYPFIKDGAVYRFNAAAPISGTSFVYNAAPTPSQFTAKLNVYPNDDQKFVIVVNARKAGNYGVALQMTLTDFLDALRFSQVSEWNSTTGAFDPLPMYAITDDVRITKTTTSIGSYDLVRMHARFDVRKKGTLGDSKFKLDNICIFNRKNVGYIGYSATKWNAASHVVTAPHVPGTMPANTEYKNTKLFYVDNNVASPNYKNIVGELYAFEAAAHSDREKMTALIIGGYYNGSGALSYYRVDVPSTATGGNILRNHLYDIEVQDVHNGGYPTPEEAFIGQTQLSAKVTPWNLAAQGTIIDGQYFLKVSHEVLDFGEDGGSPLIDLESNYNRSDRGYPQGIYITGPTYTVGAGGWLSVMNVINFDGSLTRRIRVMASANGTGTTRSAELEIKAGNMVYVLKINQSKDSWLTYTTEPQYIMDGNLKELNVKANYGWTAAIKAGTNPNGSLLSVVTTEGGKPAGEQVYFRVKDRLEDFANGLTPPSFDETVTVTFSDAKGVNMPVDVPLRLIVKLRGGSNCYMVNGTNPIEIPLSQVGIAMGFNHIPQPATKVNSFLGMDWFTPADCPNMNVAVFWSDVSPAQGPTAIVNSLSYDGGWLGSKIIVTPGSATAGNTIIILYKDNNGNGLYDYPTDEIKWSWHIWQAGVYPYNASGTPNATWIDRNLGATTVTPNIQSTYGFHYQWGRKDPYPQGPTNGSSGTIPLYWGPDVTGMNSTSFRTTTNSSANNLCLAIQTPTVFYNVVGVGIEDWYTNAATTRDDDLWGGAGTSDYLFETDGVKPKSVYDPCPTGYRIPHYGIIPPTKLTTPATITANGWGTWNYGWANSNYGGYFSAAGERKILSSMFTGSGARGFYWMASTYINNGSYKHGYLLYIDNTSLYASSTANRSNGYSVRCIAE